MLGPKRRFGKAEQTFQNAFSKQFSTFCSPNRVLTPLKSASKTHSERFVRPSKIFVLGSIDARLIFTLFVAQSLHTRAQVERVVFEADLGRVGARRNEQTNDVDATRVVLWPGGRKLELVRPR